MRSLRRYHRGNLLSYADDKTGYAMISQRNTQLRNGDYYIRGGELYLAYAISFVIIFDGKLFNIEYGRQIATGNFDSRRQTAAYDFETVEEIYEYLLRL